MALIKRNGGTVAVGSALGVKRQSVEYWIEAGFPTDRVPDIEKLTGVPASKLSKVFKGYDRIFKW